MKHDEWCERERYYGELANHCHCAERAWLRDPLPVDELPLYMSNDT